MGFQSKTQIWGIYMFFGKRQVMMSALFASMTLMAGVSFAETQNGGAPTPTDGTAPVITQPSDRKDDVRFECDFFGTFAGKNAGSLNCEARGQYDPNQIHDFLFSLQGLPVAPASSEEVPFLRFDCRDHHGKPYYRGPISIGVAPAIVDADGDNGDGRLFNTIITGVRTTAPIIVVQDFNAKRFPRNSSSSSDYNTERGSDSSSDGRRSVERGAIVSFNWFGAQVQIPGVCRFRAGHTGN